MSVEPSTPEAGDVVPELVVQPTPVQLFAFSGATWNTHRIHYDADYARDREGYPDVLVQSHLHACYVVRALRTAYGPRSQITRIGWQNRGIATPQDTLTVGGQVDEVASREAGIEATLSLEVRNQHSELCIKAWATVTIENRER